MGLHLDPPARSGFAHASTRVADCHRLRDPRAQVLGCEMANDPDAPIAVCEGCDETYHFECHDPPLKALPVAVWFCSGCEPERVSKAVSAGELLDSQGDGGVVSNDEDALADDDVDLPDIRQNRADVKRVQPRPRWECPKCRFMNHADAEVCSDCAQNGGFGVDFVASSENEQAAEEDRKSNADSVSPGEDEEDEEDEEEHEEDEEGVEAAEENDAMVEDVAARSRRSLKRKGTDAVADRVGETDRVPPYRRSKLPRTATIAVKSYADPNGDSEDSEDEAADRGRRNRGRHAAASHRPSPSMGAGTGTGPRWDDDDVTTMLMGLKTHGTDFKSIATMAFEGRRTTDECEAFFTIPNPPGIM